MRSLHALTLSRDDRERRALNVELGETAEDIADIFRGSN